MYLADFFSLFVFLTIVFSFIYFIIKLVRGGLKWTDYQNNFHQPFEHENYYHYKNKTDVLLSHDLHHRYSYKDEYNILSGRPPGSI